MATNWNMSEKESLIEKIQKSKILRRARLASLWPARIYRPSVSTTAPNASVFIEPTIEPDSMRSASLIALAPESLSSNARFLLQESQYSNSQLEDPCKSQTWPRKRVPPSSPRRGSLPSRLPTEQYPESITSSHSLELTDSSNSVDITDASALYQSLSWEPIESAVDSEMRALLDKEEEKRQLTRSIYVMCLCAVLLLILCGFVVAYAITEFSDGSPKMSEKLTSVTASSVTDHEVK